MLHFLRGTSLEAALSKFLLLFLSSLWSADGVLQFPLPLFGFLRLFIPVLPPPPPPQLSPTLTDICHKNECCYKKKKSYCGILSFQKDKKEKRKQVFIASGIIQLADFLC